MDIVETIRSLTGFDLFVIFGLMGMFVLGYVQGVVRRLLGLASLLFSFFVASQLRGPLGEFLAENWTHLPAQYSVMSGYLATFVFLSVAFTIALKVFYQTVPLFQKYPVVDELLGGVIGVVQGLFILAAVVMILDPFFELPGIPAATREFPFIREVHAAIDGSAVAVLFREQLIPAFVSIFGFLVPDDVASMFGR